MGGEEGEGAQMLGALLRGIVLEQGEDGVEEAFGVASIGVSGACDEGAKRGEGGVGLDVIVD